MTEIALYGGSFDPPHVAHVLVAAWAKASAGVDRVLVVPTYRHAFGKRSAPFADRVAMCRLAMADLRSAEISTLEEELGESLTLHTLQALRERRPSARFRLLIGADILAGAHRWHRWDDVVALAPPLVVGRGGYATPEGVGMTMPEISSTDVRDRLARGASVDGLVPPDVADYARSRGLYT